MEMGREMERERTMRKKAKGRGGDSGKKRISNRKEKRRERSDLILPIIGEENSWISGRISGIRLLE